MLVPLFVKRTTLVHYRRLIMHLTFERFGRNLKMIELSEQPRDISKTQINFDRRVSDTRKAEMQRTCDGSLRLALSVVFILYFAVARSVWHIKLLS